MQLIVLILTSVTLLSLSFLHFNRPRLQSIASPLQAIPHINKGRAAQGVFGVLELRRNIFRHCGLTHAQQVWRDPKLVDTILGHCFMHTMFPNPHHQRKWITTYDRRAMCNFSLISRVAKTVARKAMHVYLILDSNPLQLKQWLEWTETVNLVEYPSPMVMIDLDERPETAEGVAGLQKLITQVLGKVEGCESLELKLPDGVEVKGSGLRSKNLRSLKKIVLFGLISPTGQIQNALPYQLSHLVLIDWLPHRRRNWSSTLDFFARSGCSPQSLQISGFEGGYLALARPRQAGPIGKKGKKGINIPGPLALLSQQLTQLSLPPLRPHVQLSALKLVADSAPNLKTLIFDTVDSLSSSSLPSLLDFKSISVLTIINLKSLPFHDQLEPHEREDSASLGAEEVIAPLVRIINQLQQARLERVEILAERFLTAADEVELNHAAVTVIRSGRSCEATELEMAIYDLHAESLLESVE